MHSKSVREHCPRWNSRQTSSCNHLESFTFNNCDMRPFVVVVAAAVGVVNIDDDDVIDDVLLFSSYIIV